MDFAIFINHNIIIGLFVNNILIVGFDRKFVINFKEILDKKFKIIDLEIYYFYFEIIIEKNKQNRIFRIKQKIYFCQVFKNFDMKNIRKM